MKPVEVRRNGRKLGARAVRGPSNEAVQETPIFMTYL
jgi:hypothetical protein